MFQDELLYVLKSFEGHEEFNGALAFVCEILDKSPNYVMNLLEDIVL